MVEQGELLPVIQDDREAASKFYPYCNSTEMITGALDSDKLVQSFAAHRLHSTDFERGLEHKLRMIVSHATGGGSQDIDESTNDICVRISAMRSRLYLDGKARGLEAGAKMAEREENRVVRLGMVTAANACHAIATAIRALIPPVKP